MGRRPSIRFPTGETRSIEEKSKKILEQLSKFYEEKGFCLSTPQIVEKAIYELGKKEGVI